MWGFPPRAAPLQPNVPARAHSHVFSAFFFSLAQCAFGLYIVEIAFIIAPFQSPFADCRSRKEIYIHSPVFRLAPHTWQLNRKRSLSSSMPSRLDFPNPSGQIDGTSLLYTLRALHSSFFFLSLSLSPLSDDDRLADDKFNPPGIFPHHQLGAPKLRPALGLSDGTGGISNPGPATSTE